jgi:hypothetical protein
VIAHRAGTVVAAGDNLGDVQANSLRLASRDSQEQARPHTDPGPGVDIIGGVALYLYALASDQASPIRDGIGTSARATT